uniref:Ovule protein n=1 Tax=Mesocestoides corti TaxID=53468 RepID=A0A5K3FZA7_MESCO
MMSMAISGLKSQNQDSNAKIISYLRISGVVCSRSPLTTFPSWRNESFLVTNSYSAQNN